MVSFQPCGEALCAHPDCSQLRPPARCKHLSLPLFLQGGLHPHSAFRGCKDPFISSASRYPKRQSCFMPLAWSFLVCCGLAQRILGAEGKCQPLVTGATLATYADARCIPAVPLLAADAYTQQTQLTGGHEMWHSHLRHSSPALTPKYATCKCLVHSNEERLFTADVPVNGIMGTKNCYFPSAWKRNL